MRNARVFAIVAVLTLVLSGVVLASAPQLLNYQAKLTNTDGTTVSDGTYDLSFAIYDAASAGNVVWSETQTGVNVSDGLFSVILGSVNPINNAVFDGPQRYLEVTVNGEAISPRTQITSVAYAQRIATLDGATGGEITGDLTIYPALGIFTMGNVKSPELAGAAKIVLSAGASTGSISLYEPVDSKGNLAAGFQDATKRVEIQHDGLIMFGASEQDTNLVVNPNGDIVGKGQITMGQNSSSGFQTSVLGFENTADGDSSAIGGGSANQTTGTISTIAGGHMNTANGEGTFIGGGSNNTADGPYSTIGGGENNSTLGAFATVPGGNFNAGNGDYSFAAGHRARSEHAGSFVWADHTDVDFSSTGDDQFLVRASGGVGINTAAPLGAFDVNGPASNMTVNLPDSSIASQEILDEPGIASNRSTDVITLIQQSTTMQGLISVTVTTPAPGYILVSGHGTLELTGTNGRNQAYMQIDEMSGGNLLSSSYVLAGNGDYDKPTTYHYFTMSTQRVFFKPAGTYTFVLEAQAHPENDETAETSIELPNIFATYYPTSYGSVTTMVSSAEAFDFRSATPVTTSNTAATPAGSEQYYQVDLRELELKAAQARAEAERAERQLLEARLRQQTSTD
ncbi:MAG: hypothetical protein PVH24_00895 [Candidatus Zixiibacteriota bacterium]